jgi:predicted deacylase
MGGAELKQRTIPVPGANTELTAYDFGSKSPRAFITAGVHGGECTSIRVAEMLVSELERIEDSLQGSFTVIPVAHPQAFAELQRTSPVDGLNLNRVFPGNPNGQPTEAIAAALWEETKRSQYFIDLHCVWGDSITFVYVPWSKFEYARKFGESFAFDVLVDSSYAETGLAYTDANELGIPAVVIEFPGLGSRGRVDIPAAQYGFKAVMLALHRAGLVPEPEGLDAEILSKKPTRVHPSVGFTLPAGFFEPSVRPGTWISAGDPVGTVNGKVVRTPIEGLVITIPPAMYCPKDHVTSISIGVRFDKPKPERHEPRLKAIW